MKRLSLVTALLVSITGFAAVQNVEKKSNKEGCHPTSMMSQNEDEQLFLTPHLQSDVSQLAGQLVLDAGCGSGSWAQALVAKGAQVCALDSNKESLERVQMAIAVAGIEEQVSLMEGNVVALPFEDESFDGAVSVQVGQELPPTTHFLSGDQYCIGGLELHMLEVARVLKSGGVATVVAPASYDVVFTDGSEADEVVFRHIDKVLLKLGKNADSETVKAQLAQLTEVNRATFVERDGKLELVTSASDLHHGQKIWRKEFDQVQAGFFHSEEEYLVALANAGLKCVEVKRPCFFGNVKYRLYQEANGGNTKLGSGYIDNNPFTIYTVVKSPA